MTEIRFGTDGWRGIIAQDVTFDQVRQVARAIARRVRAECGDRLLLVGYDTRFLSDKFARVAAEAIASEGLPVALAQAFAPTPAFSYAVVHRRAAGAIVITASHNPPEYSGVKFKASFGGSAPVSFTQGVEAEIERLRAESRILSAERRVPSAECRLTDIERFDARTPWLDRLESLVDLDPIGRSGIRVVLDVMYGAGQGLLAERLRRAGCQVREIHAELNPYFGGFHPEPIPANMAPAQAAVTGWDGLGVRVGFAFDGDSDRIAPIDEDGQIVTPHQVLALLVRHLVRNRTERGVIVKSFNIGRMVDLEAAALDLPLVVTPIGFKFIAAAMQENQALVGGEESGGFAIRGHIPERDAGLVALLLLQCMAMTGKSLATLVRDMEEDYGPHRYGRVDLRLASLAERDRVVAEIAKDPPAYIAGQAVCRVDSLDGVKLVRTDESWIMLRASGTEPLLRVYAEAPHEQDVRGLLDWGQHAATKEPMR
ncbi:MAG TPA: phosphoglucomutase/phosphomannomutase family protein [Candidatus Baltobacteraceae bacterium]|nr:phosphoglucomutase/phosphomannomutase family protein [Candidatus Baltobacteraceae bacterium]